MSQVSHVKSMQAAEAAKALESALVGHRGDLTIADASAKSGLALRDAELGMHSLLSTYRGHLRVTDEGELLFRFPHGFTKPWETRTRVEKAAKAVGKFAVGLGRFLVRAWISIVLIGYVAIFVALMIALAFAQSSDDRRGRSSFDGFGGYIVMRIVFDALFWTFHPFSPVSIQAGRGYGPDRARHRGKADGVPFYEKVNRFFFGPPVKEPDPRAMERAIVAEIREKKGRIGLADVIRVTGLPRDEADPMMARLMLDYDGTVEATDSGAIVYRFESIRKTAASEPTAPPPKPIWSKIQRLAPLTGNSAGTNGLIIALNGFNLLMSTYAMSAGLTLERIYAIIEQSRQPPPHFIPPPETAIALGVVPFVFSLALFALPLGRVLYRRHRAKVVARENGRRAVLREILEKASTTALITDEGLKRAWQGAAGVAPDTKQLTREIVALGGDVDVTDAGVVRYRFPELEAEAEALEAEREAASEAEAKVGKVIFASDE